MNLKLMVAGIFTCATVLTAPPSYAQSLGSQATEVSIMAYNIENLFDNKRDNENDQTYLPITLKNTKEHFRFCMKITNDFYRDECLNFDYSDELLQTKLNRIADVIAGIDNGTGPDILIVEEVENISILRRLMREINSRIPKTKTYKEAVLLEGWDDRGIDIGMISRLPRSGAVNIYPVKKDNKILDSRGILHSVYVLPGGEKLNVFGVHFPSGSAPTPFREAAIAALNEQLAKLPAGSLAVTGGDFNINSTEDPVHKLYSEQLGSKWLVSHLIGCKGCLGTEFFNRDQTWSFLDAILFTKNLKSPKSAWNVDVDSIAVPNEGPQQTLNGKPFRFSPEGGVADHWPVYARLKKNK